MAGKSRSLSEYPISDLVHKVMTDVAKGTPILRWGEMGSRWYIDSTPPKKLVQNPDSVASYHLYANGVLATLNARVKRDHPVFGWGPQENIPGLGDHKVWESAHGALVPVEEQRIGDDPLPRQVILYGAKEMVMGQGELNFSGIGLALWLPKLFEMDLVNSLRDTRGWSAGNSLPIGPLNPDPFRGVQDPTYRRFKRFRKDCMGTPQSFYVVPLKEFGRLFQEREKAFVESGRVGETTERNTRFDPRGRLEVTPDFWVEIGAPYISVKIPAKPLFSRGEWVPVEVGDIGESGELCQSYVVAHSLGFNLNSLAPPEKKGTVSYFNGPWKGWALEDTLRDQSYRRRAWVHASELLAQSLDTYEGDLVVLSKQLGPLMDAFLKAAQRSRPRSQRKKVASQ